MGIFTQPMPPVANVGAGLTATCDLPPGFTYDKLLLEATNNGADIAATAAGWAGFATELRLIVNGRVEWRVNAGDLAAINLYEGKGLAAGILPLYLKDPTARTIDGEELGGFGTGFGTVSSFTLEVDLAGGLVNPTLKVHSRQSDPTPWGPHRVIAKHVDNVPAIQTMHFTDILKGAYATRRIHFTSDAVGRVMVTADGRKVYDMTAKVRAEENRQAGRSDQTGYTHVDFITTNRMADAMPMDVNDFRVEADFTAAAGAISYYVDAIQSPYAS